MKRLVTQPLGYPMYDNLFTLDDFNDFVKEEGVNFSPSSFNDDFDIVKLCTKTITLDNGSSFNTYFAYFFYVSDDGSLVEKVNYDGNAKSVKVTFTQDLFKKFVSDNVTFPKFLVVAKIGSDNPLWKKCGYITIDKDRKTNKLRLTKDGRRVPILILSDVIAMYDSPRRNLSVDDVLEMTENG